MSWFKSIINYFTKSAPEESKKAMPAHTNTKSDPAKIAESETIRLVETPEETTPMNYSDKLSENFYLYEFLNSQTAKRKGIDNTPTVEHLNNIKSLVTKLLQPLRTNVSRPVSISSGYRSSALNTKVGGSSSSQHCKGEAVDIEVFGMTNVDLAKLIRDNFEFDQLILEFYNPKEGPNSGWVHVSYTTSKKNRRQVLTAFSVDGKTTYAVGLPH